MTRQIAEAEVRGILRGGYLEDGCFVYHDHRGRQEVPMEQAQGLRILQEVDG